MVENEANVVGMLQMKSNSRNLKKMVIPNKRVTLSVAPFWLLAVGAMKKISSHKIVFLKYWGAKIDVLEKKKLHKQQLLEKS